jgi:hypothetical protein
VIAARVAGGCEVFASGAGVVALVEEAGPGESSGSTADGCDVVIGSRGSTTVTISKRVLV